MYGVIINIHRNIESVITIENDIIESVRNNDTKLVSLHKGCMEIDQIAINYGVLSNVNSKKYMHMNPKWWI